LVQGQGPRKRGLAAQSPERYIYIFFIFYFLDIDGKMKLLLEEAGKPLGL